jgi:hypothetical protein
MSGSYVKINWVSLLLLIGTDMLLESLLHPNVSAVPTAPGAPVPTDWSQNHVDLIWKEPVSDGGSPITGYIIEKKDKYRYATSEA